MIRRVASTPSMPGMIRSISTRSGVSCAQSSTASAPLRRDPDDLVLGCQRQRAPQRLDGHRQVVDDADPHARGLADQVDDRLQQRLVVEAALGQVVVGAGLEAAQAVLLAVLVGHDHDRQRFQLRILLDQRDQLDAVHARHVDVGDDQVEVAAAHRVPAVHAVDRDLDLVAVVLEQLALAARARSASRRPPGRACAAARPASAAARRTCVQATAWRPACPSSGSGPRRRRSAPASRRPAARRR